MLVLMTYFRVHFLVATAALVGCLLGSSSAIARPTASPNWNRDNPVSHAPLHRPRQNKGSSDPVTWNGDSFSVIGENIFLYAAEVSEREGEMHIISCFADIIKHAVPSLALACSRAMA